VGELRYKAEKTAGNGKKFALMAVVVVVILGLLGWGLSNVLKGNSGKKVKAPKISLIPTAPPPPPPPPKIEKKPPDPPKDQKEIKVEQPVQKAEAPAPSPELKMDGPAGDGPSNFAAGRITSEDLSKVGVGTGKVGGVNPFSNYASMLKGEMQRYLRKNKVLRLRQYRTEVRVWIGNDGSLKRAELIGGTGDADTDEAIREALKIAPAFTESPPANMPQPIRLRIVTTGRE